MSGKKPNVFREKSIELEISEVVLENLGVAEQTRDFPGNVESVPNLHAEVFGQKSGKKIG